MPWIVTQPQQSLPAGEFVSIGLTSQNAVGPVSTLGYVTETRGVASPPMTIVFMTLRQAYVGSVLAGEIQARSAGGGFSVSHFLNPDGTFLIVPSPGTATGVILGSILPGYGAINALGQTGVTPQDLADAARGAGNVVGNTAGQVVGAGVSGAVSGVVGGVTGTGTSGGLGIGGTIILGLVILFALLLILFVVLRKTGVTK